MEEERRYHPVYESYFADDAGNIYHRDRPESPLKTTLRNSGYRDVHLQKQGQKRSKHYLVHRFTYECFHGLVPRNMDVHHIDGNRENNSLTNLAQVTHRTNVQLRHGYRGNVFEHISTLPDDAISVDKIKGNEFDNLYYSSSNDAFYVATGNVYVKKNVDKDNRIHVMNVNGKVCHHKVSVIKSSLLIFAEII